jgi:prepilin signal peptidase PulO-like enzyme (type II secretory pathway)
MEEPMIPLWMRLTAVFTAGACLGALVNWAIYTYAWRPRWISPWSAVPIDATPRRWFVRLPLIGWLGLRHEAAVHGRGFWFRPLLIELGLASSLVALYWWEVVRYGLVQGQIGVPVVPPAWVLHAQFTSHVILLCWMLSASFIDIDEKIVPDEITVTGTLLGLALATLVPMSLLPQITEWPVPPVVGEPLANPAGAPAIGPGGGTFWVEPVTIVPQPLPNWLLARHWPSLVIALGCYWLWCFALAPRIWRGRRGMLFGLELIFRRSWRELTRLPLGGLLLIGTPAIVACWAIIHSHWIGLVTSLVGLVGSGGIVWAVRLIGTFALRREAMGFGDVTLMMMVGTFLGWQACLIAFFLAPFAGLLVGLLQFVLRRDDVIPYAPYLCMASAVVVIAWAPIWTWAQPMFEHVFLVPAVLAVCLMLLGVLLFVWRKIKECVLSWAA